MFANAKHADDPIYARDGLVIRTWRHIAKQSYLFRPTNRVSLDRRKLQRTSFLCSDLHMDGIFAFRSDRMKIDFVPK